jgi:hypothetical protein
LNKTGGIDRLEEQRQTRIKELLATIPLAVDDDDSDFDADDIELADSDLEEDDDTDLMTMLNSFMKPEGVNPLTKSQQGDSDEEGGLTGMITNLLKSK